MASSIIHHPSSIIHHPSADAEHRSLKELLSQKKKPSCPGQRRGEESTAGPEGEAEVIEVSYRRNRRRNLSGTAQEWNEEDHECSLESRNKSGVIPEASALTLTGGQPQVDPGEVVFDPLLVTCIITLLPGVSGENPTLSPDGGHLK